MSGPVWQIPWAGPRLEDLGKPSWSVMPSPGLGNAEAICVPVRIEDNQVVLALAGSPTSIPTTQAPLGLWTEVVAAKGQDPSGYLCLLRYDQPPSDLPDNWNVTLKLETGQEISFSVDAVLALQWMAVSDTVAVIELDAVLKTWRGADAGESILREVLPLPGRRTRILAPANRSSSNSVPGGDAAGRADPGAANPAAAASLTLAFGSCQYPAGLLDAEPAEASLERLAKLLDTATAASADPGARTPEMLLLLGDQIYADATAGLLDPVRLDDRYRIAYEGLLRIKALRRIMGRIPVHWMLDDHEIADNWEPYAAGAKGRRFRKGVTAYWTYQRGAVPPGMDPPPATWFTVPATGSGPGWSLFMADTRTWRQPRYADTRTTAEILGKSQRKALENWLSAQHPDSLKLIAAPAMLLPRLREHMDEPLYLDNWQGYPASLARLLAYICDNQIRNVCYLSGDAHLGCDANITVTSSSGMSAELRALHAPAWYAPMPFANEQAYNLALPHDQFDLSWPGAARTYRCEVSASILPNTRDGCCLLKADPIASGQWSIHCEVI